MFPITSHRPVEDAFERDQWFHDMQRLIDSLHGPERRAVGLLLHHGPREARRIAREKKVRGFERAYRSLRRYAETLELYAWLEPETSRHHRRR